MNDTVAQTLPRLNLFKSQSTVQEFEKQQTEEIDSKETDFRRRLWEQLGLIYDQDDIEEKNLEIEGVRKVSFYIKQKQVEIKIDAANYLPRLLRLLQRQNYEAQDEFQIFEIFKLLFVNTKNEQLTMRGCQIIEDLKTFWFSLWFNTDFDNEIEQIIINQHTDPQSPIETRRRIGRFSTISPDNSPLRQTMIEMLEEEEEENDEQDIKKIEYFEEWREKQKEDNAQAEEIYEILLNIDEFFVQANDKVPTIGKNTFMTEFFKKSDHFNIILSFLFAPLNYEQTQFMSNAKFPYTQADIDNYIVQLKETFRFRNIQKEYLADIKTFFAKYNIRSYFTMLMLTDSMNLKFMINSNNQIIKSFFLSMYSSTIRENFVGNMNHIIKVTEFFLRIDKDSALYHMIQFNIMFILLLFLDFASVNRLLSSLILCYPEPHNFLTHKNQQKLWQYLYGTKYFLDLAQLMLHPSFDKFNFSKCQVTYKPILIFRLLNEKEPKYNLSLKPEKTISHFPLFEEQTNFRTDIDNLKKVLFGQRSAGNEIERKVQKNKLIRSGTVMIRKKKEPNKVLVKLAEKIREEQYQQKQLNASQTEEQTQQQQQQQQNQLQQKTKMQIAQQSSQTDNKSIKKIKSTGDLSEVLIPNFDTSKIADLPQIQKLKNQQQPAKRHSLQTGQLEKMLPELFAKRGGVSKFKLQQQQSQQQQPMMTAKEMQKQIKAKTQGQQQKGGKIEKRAISIDNQNKNNNNNNNNVSNSNNSKERRSSFSKYLSGKAKSPISLGKKIVFNFMQPPQHYSQQLESQINKINKLYPSSQLFQAKTSQDIECHKLLQALGAQQIQHNYSSICMDIFNQILLQCFNSFETNKLKDHLKIESPNFVLLFKSLFDADNQYFFEILMKVLLKKSDNYNLQNYLYKISLYFQHQISNGLESGIAINLILKNLQKLIFQKII